MKINDLPARSFHEHDRYTKSLTIVLNTQRHTIKDIKKINKTIIENNEVNQYKV